MSKNDVMSDSPNKIRHGELGLDHRAFEVHDVAKNHYNTPNPKSQSRRQYSSPNSSHSSRACIHRQVIVGEGILSSEQIKGGKLVPISHNSAKTTKSNAKISTDLSNYTDSRKYNQGDKVQSFKSGPMPNYANGAIETDDLKNADLGVVGNMPCLLPHYSQQAEIHK